MALLKPAQHLGLILSQVPHAGAHATEHEGQRQAGGAGRNHRQRGTTPAPHHQPHGEDRGHELDASRRDERRGRPAVLPVQVGLDPEQAEHQDDLVQLNEVHVAQEELRRENEGDDERPGRATPPGREREQHAPRRPVFAPQNPGHGLAASSDDRYARAAGKTRSWASASEPSNDAPAAFVCPPPPKRPASSATSTSPSDRKLTLTFPFARLRNSSASCTPAMQRGYSTIPSSSSSVAPRRRSASGGTGPHA